VVVCLLLGRFLSRPRVCGSSPRRTVAPCMWPAAVGPERRVLLPDRGAAADRASRAPGARGGLESGEQPVARL